ncbi:T9SS type A sorting domain-containing protein [Candidatus Symbiothrix dinenymphae]|uniref:T9SS type A sorting domain-containing protein n=1 Tax=Candidatus Symbiothrix dinenymphae TaxID=467085 RepID=UPI0009EB845C|nr:T9SS type A sorting domain-containing protein [Candidatus Symbiothrix dinenymphae]
MKKSFVFCLLLMTGIVGVFGDENVLESIRFGYDAAGNRVSRSVVYDDSPLRSANDTTFYSEMLAEMVIKIYPNPTEGLLQVSIENMKEGTTAQIALYNLQGNLITTQKGIRDVANLNITSQPAGVYLLHIIAGTEHTKWKIIKK